MSLYLEIAIGYLVVATLVQTGLLVLAGLIKHDVLHSIEEIKHLLILSQNSNGKIDTATLSQFLNPSPVQPGDVKFHIPDTLLAFSDDD